MSDVVLSLDDASRAALVQLAVRGTLRTAVTPELQALIDVDLAMAKGPIIMPTVAGTARVGEMLRLPADGEVEQSVRRQFETFLPINHNLREICTSWQIRPDGAANDHTDPAYDASVRDELDDVDEKIGRVLRRLNETLPSLGHYRADLSEALERFDAGDMSALTSPLSASYHTVWMWLHQELLLMLGISRAEDERLEAALVSGNAV